MVAFVDELRAKQKDKNMETLIDKRKTQEVLNESCCGWDETWTWDIIRKTINEEITWNGTIEELEYINTQLNVCIRAIKRNKDKVTYEENYPAE